MIVNVLDQQSDLIIHPEAIQHLVKRVLLAENQCCDEVNIYFVDSPTICELHKQYFDDPSPTDCISFPIDEEENDIPYRILGEVFVCPATAVKYGKDHDINPYEEVTLYIIHGLLHLMGYDDIEDEDRQCMREAEGRLMEILKTPNSDREQHIV